MAGRFLGTYWSNFNPRNAADLVNEDSGFDLADSWASTENPTVGSGASLGLAPSTALHALLPGGGDTMVHIWDPVSASYGIGLPALDSFCFDWRGNSGNATFYGGNRNDLLLGGNGTDYLDGGAGNDRIWGGTGDTILGGQGNDVVTVDAAPALVNGGDGTDTLIVTGSTSFGAGSITNVERIVVAAGTEVSFAGLAGGLNIALRAGSGLVTEVTGTGGNDRINAGAGDSLMFGGRGDDLLIGGAGADQFGYVEGDGRDTFARFQSGTDVIAISTALATGFGDLDITEQNGTRSVIDFGDGDQIIVSGVVGLTQGDFLFV